MSGRNPKTFKTHFKKRAKMDMVELTFSDENDTNPDQLMIAENDEGQELVEVVTKSDDVIVCQDQSEGHSLSETHVQVQGEGGEVVEIDLMNFRLVKCDDEGGTGGTYKLLSPNGTERIMTIEGLQGVEGGSEGSVTCVLQEEEGPSTSVQTAEEPHKQYIVTQNEDRVPLVFYEEEVQKQVDIETPVDEEDDLKKKMAILARAKIMAEKTMRQYTSGTRKRKNELPPALELLSSPDFKLFLYHCKQCTFKCNSIRELTKHRADTHGTGSRWKGRGGRAAPALQCARCPFRAATRIQLTRHYEEQHASEESVEMMIDVFVCQACGYENSSKSIFRKHACTGNTE